MSIFGTVTRLQASSKKSDNKDNSEKVRGKDSDLSSIYCIENIGIHGDGNSKGDHRQVTLMDDSVRAWIENQPIKGLCSSKFKENITIKGLDFGQLRPKVLLQIGETVLEISPVTKKCYQQTCKIYKEGLDCPIPSGCFFAKVVQSGQIQLADKCILL
jgi:MOSC domain-containing protein YiiM